MTYSKANEVNRLKYEMSELFGKDALHILNGQFMYDEFKDEKLMGNSDFAPFNEAMCINESTDSIFSADFIKTRAAGHQQSIDNYIDQVIKPLDLLFNKVHKYIVLWFGEDMFCQINLLTIIAYLEQIGYGGKIFLHSFSEQGEFKVEQRELRLGSYASIYNSVLIQKQKPEHINSASLAKAINDYLDLLNESNQVTQYISEHLELSNDRLLIKLFKQFPDIGYGDSQYLKLIKKIR